MGIFSGKRPDNLGAVRGRLAPCRSTPNCVSSQADLGDRTHYIEPLRFAGDPARAWAVLEVIVRGMERVNVVHADGAYLYAEFTSRLMGYVDDVEFLLDAAARVIHARSASRLGIRDFGVNRERIETIRGRLAAAGAS
jgi:uncharacterized protein (DUF1499 family)